MRPGSDHDNSNKICFGAVGGRVIVGREPRAEISEAGATLSGDKWDMRNQSLRRRLAKIESRFDGAATTLQEMKDLIVFAPSSVLEEVLRPPLHDYPARVEEDAGVFPCPECGHSRSAKTIDPSTLLEFRSAPNRHPTTVLELESAIERSRPGLFDEAVMLALREIDRTTELIALDCPECGYRALSTRPSTRTAQASVAAPL